MSQLEGNVIKIRDAVTEILTQATCKRGLQVWMRCGVKPEPALPDATIRKFRTVARERAWCLKSLVAQRKPLPASKNKKGEA